jgi:hypothetical protein
MTSLLASGNAPFFIAIALMCVIGLIEALALLVGFSFTEHASGALTDLFQLDHAAPGELGFAGQSLCWLHVGRIPLLVLLVLFLCGFALAGICLQWATHRLFGITVPVALAVPIAVVAAIFFVRSGGKLVAHFVPAIETTALTEESFVGHMVRIVTGEASRGKPAEARFTDRFGQAHYVRVEPEHAAQTFPRGMQVQLVARVSASVYLGRARPDVASLDL